MPFQSKAQERFAFATKQPWAEEWAHETPKGADLPEHVPPKAEGHKAPKQNPPKQRKRTLRHESHENIKEGLRESRS